jgi:sn-glycerol 3-phosphate transport system ATP-binding protein
MEEPLSNLDAKLRAAVRKDIKKLQSDLGITIVYVTHDQTEAMSMADKVVLMKDGLIQQIGTPEQLYSEPATTFVAEFVGAPPMALIEGAAIEGFSKNQTLGIRAEYMEFVPSGGRLTCVVTDCEFLGAETFIGLAHERANGLTVKLEGKANMALGSLVDITFDDKDLHVFGPEGRRMINT